jgi:hypothetical protein
MKSISTLLVIFFTFTGLFGQENFKVIKVNGNIVLRDKGVSLETGTVFSEKEDLLFRTDDAVAAVINPEKGRLILTSKSHDLSAASSNYLPSMYNISSRGFGALLTTTDLQNHFSGKYVVLGSQKVEIERRNFPMDENNFFFLRYQYKGEEINKKLAFSTDTLIIDKSSLFTVDGKPIPSPDNTSIRLFYRKGSESIEISRFDLIFPDTDMVWKEVSVILDGMKTKNTKEKIGEITSYMNGFYGKVNPENLVLWLKKDHGLTLK